MKIELNKRKCRCAYCRNPITLKYRLIDEWGNKSHLSCYKKKFEIKFKLYKNFRKEINKQKYKRIMMLEVLE